METYSGCANYNLYHTCRGCLSLDGTMLDILTPGEREQNLLRIYMGILNSEVSTSDYPFLLCHQCEEKLLQNHAFQNQCQKSYKVIEMYLTDMADRVELNDVVVKEENIITYVVNDNDNSSSCNNNETVTHASEKKDIEFIALDNNMDTDEPNPTKLKDFCEKCNENVQSLSKHQSKFHVNEVLIKSEDTQLCSHCGEIFSSNSLFVEHLQTHINEASSEIDDADLPFICRVCNKLFHGLEALKNHVAIHAGENVEPNSNNERFHRTSDLTSQRPKIKVKMAKLTRHATPPELLNTAKIDTMNLLPEKSKEKYMSVYDKFIVWQQQKNTTSFSENVLLAYFSDLALSLKPSSLWSCYSMLKSTLSIHHNIDLQAYTKLIAFLKKRNVGFKSKKSKVFTADEMTKFLNDAPDHQYLATKVCLIFGINGACRREELCNMHLKDIKEYDNSTILVKLPFTKTNMERSFTITDKFYNFVKQYMSLRPKESKSDRFFLNYQNGKCTQQPIGINKFGNMPKSIATYLGLQDPELYTGHSFRRTSATLLVDAGADLITLKRHGGWKSNQVAEGYIEDSISNKRKISDKIGQSINITSKNQENAGSSTINQHIEHDDTSDTNESLDDPPFKIAKIP